jgi:site-specific recombinase XerD
MRRWDGLLEGYVQECRVRGLCPESVDLIQRELERWGVWLRRCRPRPVLERLEPQLLVDYLTSRSTFKAKSTVYRTLSTMRGMGDYLVRQGVWTSNALRWMKGPKISPYQRVPRRLDRAHIERLWREAACVRGAHSRHLWVTTLALLYGTGLRRGELERLNVDAVDRVEGVLRLDGRKTGRERCVPLPEIVRRCLEVYLPERHNVLEAAGRLSQSALLITRRGERLHGQQISNGIHAIARRAQVPFKSLHQFRHSCASELLAAGVHVAEVQRILGHASVATTVIYTHIADPERRAAIARHSINELLAVALKEAA